jgi:hypothetical protein
MKLPCSKTKSSVYDLLLPGASFSCYPARKSCKAPVLTYDAVGTDHKTKIQDHFTGRLTPVRVILAAGQTAVDLAQGADQATELLDLLAHDAHGQAALELFLC